MLQVQITRRVTLEETTCSAQATTSSAILNAQSKLECQEGCKGSRNIGDTELNCVDFMISDCWSTGEQTYTRLFSGNKYFEVS